MGEKTGIAWTDHTFNPWWGCEKVSPACTHCYAETLDHRLGGGHWGPNGTRKFFGDKHWNEPLRWNAAAEKAGVRARVFCASMADVFEGRPELAASRNRLWNLIERTPHLDWLLLTKRPENIEIMLPPPIISVDMANKTGGTPQPFFTNVWLGTTVEDQGYADARVPLLLKNPAVVHFLSIEPQLGLIVLQGEEPAPAMRSRSYLRGVDGSSRVNWVIAGCESGHGARAMDLAWTRSLRDQCARQCVAFFLKQATAVDGSITPPITLGKDSWSKRGQGFDHGELVELPYLDGVQHAEFPTPRGA